MTTVCIVLVYLKWKFHDVSIAKMILRSARLRNRFFSRFEERPDVESSESSESDDNSQEDGPEDNLDGDFSDIDPDTEIELTSETDDDDNEEDDQPASDSVPAEQLGSATYFFAQNPRKSQRKWCSSPPPVHKIPVSHLVRERQGITARTVQAINFKLDAFKLIVPEVLIQIIVRETNRKAKRFQEELHQEYPNQKHRPWHDTNINGIYGLIGILIFCGAHNQWNESMEELFSKENRPFCRAVMSLERAQQLLRFMRFDDQRTRTDRLRTDRLAAFRDMWNIFSDAISRSYTPSPDLTIDEQLVATRGRCSFRQYIPSKPGKYGIKIFWICDAPNSFPLKGEIYVGKQPDEVASQNFVVSLVQRLSAQYVGKGRTIAMDNYFTKCELAEKLLAKNTTIVGTIRSNKPDLLKEFTKKTYIARREIGSSRFCFDNMLTLVSYVPKKNKNVLLLSTLHNDAQIDPQTNKPNIIMYYNQNKSGVDTLDHLVRLYTCKRKTMRWPMVLFFNLIDVAGVAAYRLYSFANEQWMENS